MEHDEPKCLYAKIEDKYFIGPLHRAIREDYSQMFIGFEFCEEADCRYWADITGWATKNRINLYMVPIVRNIKIFLQTKAEVEKWNTVRVMQELLK